MTLLASENFTSQHWTETLKCSAEIKLDDILKVETISKPLSFAEVNLLKALLRRWQGFIKTRRLTKKYFSSWKAYWKKSAAMQGESTSQKIDNLISALHQMKIKRRKFERSNSDEPSPSDKLLRYRANSLSNECFRHRFKTQKEIIDTQKAKLEEQSRIIQDLKLGIIRDELSKSLEHTRSELREIFSKSSHKLKCKTAPSGIKLEDTLANFIINSNKAPKFLQQMEMRALERARNREIIRERKRIIDEEKQRAFEQTVEQKRKQDEEEKRRGLEAIKEKQRAELERQKLIQMNKEIYLANVKKADRFFKRNIMKKCMNRLQHNVYRSKNNMLQAERFHERTLKKTAIRRWKQYIEGKYKEQNEKADVFLRKFLLTETFKLWKDYHKECIQNYQVAEDYNEIKLASNVIKHWYRFVCIQYLLEQKNLRRAETHYKNHIIVQYFYQWKTLPAIVQLEKAKEEKKKKWREKVKEIIPDYSPPTED